MDACYQIADTSSIISPGLVIFRDIVEQNLDRMIAIAGSPDRLRPHCKTHKTAEIIKLQLERGITRHKCATFAEAEMVANAGAKDIVLAYSLVGPNVQRAVKFVETFPDVTFALTADHPLHVSKLAEAMQQAGQQIGVLLDIDTGQHRTGIPVGDAARQLYQQIADSEGLIAAGFHVYDGHQHQTCRDDRREAVNVEWNKVAAFRSELEAAGLAVPKLVCGGTASFPIYAEKDDPGIEMSPGTCVYNDCGYGQKFPDMVFPPAALMLTRVISRPTADRITLDLGYKSVASDPPVEKRAEFPELPDAKIVLQNEEHLVIESSRAGEFQPGDVLLAVPRHICPTSALHKSAWVVSNGEIVDTWQIASRDRWITI